MLSYPNLLSHLDGQVESILPDQIRDGDRRERGGFVSPRDGMAGGTHIGCVQTLGFAWLCEGSRYYGDPHILERILLAAGFARSVRRPSGLFDLITTDWDSGPYTAFLVKAIAPVVAAARRSPLDGASEIDRQWVDTLSLEGRGVVVVGEDGSQSRGNLTA